jgi:iron complex transport system permease protein
LAILFAQARALNLLAIGEATAAYLGASVERTKLLAFATATLLTAASVSVSGTIGFVGLVVPHAIRLIWGSDNRALLPCSALAGAAFLVAADTLSRSLAGANELPVGIVTALVGVPCFVWLLRRPTATGFMS